MCPQPMRLTAIVVNWRTPELTVRAVQALTGAGIAPAHVVVVDNASGDGSAQSIGAALPEVEVVVLTENVGFARANNEAARRRPADVFLLVNSDAIVQGGAGTIRALLEPLGRPDVGIVVPLLLNEDLTVQPSVAPLPSLLVAAVQASGLSRFVPDGLQPSLGTYWRHEREREVQAATGAVMLVRRSLWEALGGLDESSFMYAEDRDLCWRARRAGWSVWFTPRAAFVHLGSASAGGRWSAAQRAERVGAAEAAMVRRHLGPARAALTLAVIRSGLRARAFGARVIGQPEAAARFSGALRGFSARAQEGA